MSHPNMTQGWTLPSSKALPQRTATVEAINGGTIGKNVHTRIHRYPLPTHVRRDHRRRLKHLEIAVVGDQPVEHVAWDGAGFVILAGRGRFLLRASSSISGRTSWRYWCRSVVRATTSAASVHDEYRATSSCRSPSSIVINVCTQSFSNRRFENTLECLMGVGSFLPVFNNRQFMDTLTRVFDVISSTVFFLRTVRFPSISVVFTQ